MAFLRARARAGKEVVLTDFRMPGMNGTEFLCRVKDIYPDTIRIVLSGYADLALVTEANKVRKEMSALRKQRLAVLGLVSSTLAYAMWGAATAGWMVPVLVSGTVSPICAVRMPSKARCAALMTRMRAMSVRSEPAAAVERVVQ